MPLEDGTLRINLVQMKRVGDVEMETRFFSSSSKVPWLLVGAVQ